MNDVCLRQESGPPRVPTHFEGASGAVRLTEAMRKLMDGSASRRIVRDARIAVALHMAELAAPIEEKQP